MARDRVEEAFEAKYPRIPRGGSAQRIFKAGATWALSEAALTVRARAVSHELNSKRLSHEAKLLLHERILEDDAAARSIEAVAAEREGEGEG